MVLGNLVIYAVGVTWLKVALDATWGQAWELGMEPFLGGDALKIVLAAGLFPAAWLGLKKLGLAPRTDEPDGAPGGVARTLSARGARHAGALVSRWAEPQPGKRATPSRGRQPAGYPVLRRPVAIPLIVRERARRRSAGGTPSVARTRCSSDTCR